MIVIKVTKIERLRFLIINYFFLYFFFVKSSCLSISRPPFPLPPFVSFLLKLESCFIPHLGCSLQSFFFFFLGYFFFVLIPADLNILRRGQIGDHEYVLLCLHFSLFSLSFFFTALLLWAVFYFYKNVCCALVAYTFFSR